MYIYIFLSTCFKFSPYAYVSLAYFISASSLPNQPQEPIRILTQNPNNLFGFGRRERNGKNNFRIFFTSLIWKF